MTNEADEAPLTEEVLLAMNAADDVWMDRLLSISKDLYNMCPCQWDAALFTLRAARAVASTSNHEQQVRAEAVRRRDAWRKDFENGYVYPPDEYGALVDDIDEWMARRAPDGDISDDDIPF